MCSAKDASKLNVFCCKNHRNVYRHLSIATVCMQCNLASPESCPQISLTRSALHKNLHDPIHIGAHWTICCRPDHRIEGAILATHAYPCVGIHHSAFTSSILPSQALPAGREHERKLLIDRLMYLRGMLAATGGAAWRLRPVLTSHAASQTTSFTDQSTNQCTWTSLWYALAHDRESWRASVLNSLNHTTPWVGTVQFSLV